MLDLYYQYVTGFDDGFENNLRIIINAISNNNYHR